MNSQCLQLCHIAKSFPVKDGSDTLNQVLKDITVKFYTGKIHTVLGENGSGKSTLMDILSGSRQPSGGTITLDGAPVVFSHPADALKAGIAIVHQNPVLPERFSIGEAFAAAQTAPPSRGGLQPEDIMGRCGIILKATEKIKNCTALQRLHIALVCALMHKPLFLILDEPGALLSAGERAGVYRLLHILAQQNTGIILISHHPQEAAGESDFTSVLENGVLRPFDRETDGNFYHTAGKNSGSNRAAGSPVLVLRNISVHRAEKTAINNVSLTVHAGEICTLTGHHQDGLGTLEDVLTGFARPDSGTMQINGTQIAHFTPAEIRAAGTGIVPAKKTAKAAGLNIPVYETLGVPLLRRRNRIATSGMLRRAAARLLEAEGFTANPGMNTAALSGGMLQRLILRREMESRPALLVLADPLQGLDRKSAARFCPALAAAAAAGTAVVILTPDADATAAISTATYRLNQGALL